MAVRSEAEITMAAVHISEAIVGGPREKTAILGPVLDVLMWVLDKPSRFQEEVMEPCNRIDQARNN